MLDKRTATAAVTKPEKAIQTKSISTLFMYLDFRDIPSTAF
jgi:hypothetical protein